MRVWKMYVLSTYCIGVQSSPYINTYIYLEQYYTCIIELNTVVTLPLRYV